LVGLLVGWLVSQSVRQAGRQALENLRKSSDLLPKSHYLCVTFDSDLYHLSL
jgi:hypothetical protein